MRKQRRSKLNVSFRTPESNNLSCFRLALYVYEYLLHAGAQKAAQTFLNEVSLDLIKMYMILNSIISNTDPVGKEHHLGRASGLLALLVVVRQKSLKQPSGVGEKRQKLLVSASSGICIVQLQRKGTPATTAARQKRFTTM